VKSWPRGIDAITLFVADLDGARAFYQDVFGLPVFFEDNDSVVFDFGNTIINLLREESADELIGPRRVADDAAGSRFQLTLDVDDVDQTCEELTKKGVVLNNGPIDRPWGVRTASFQDPAGHVWEIAKRLE
jgi:catechol 2,3-dioxygenase-like lactoylglutathione lyase family enzyme